MLRPLLLFLILYIVFVKFLRLGAGVPHYPVYLLAGLASWIFFAVSMQSAARSMVDSAELIKKVRFPRQLVAFSMVATQAVTYAVMMAILVVLSLVFVPAARSTVWLALPLAVVFVGFVAGLALLFACLNVLYRDVEHVLAAALLPWFFVTPILWRVATLHPSAQRHHLLLDVLRFGNPVAPPIYAIRDALWSGHLPRLADVIYLVVAAAAAMALGALVFKRVDDRIAVEL